jgi:hypothetical protein
MDRLEIVAVTALLVGGAPSPRAQSSVDVVHEQRAAVRSIPSQSAITDPSLMAVSADHRLVGREVAFQDVPVRRVSSYGFWISTRSVQDEVFVIPAEGRLISARAGDRVSIYGEVRQMVAGVHRLLFDGDPWKEHIYIHAFTVRPTGLWEDGGTQENGKRNRVESSNLR